MQRGKRKSAVIFSWMLGLMILLSVLSIPVSDAKAEVVLGEQYSTDLCVVQAVASTNSTLSTPKISVVTNTSTGVKISWGKVSGAAKYRVFYKTGSSGWKKITDVTSTSYTWTGAKSGTKYTFTVRCLSSDGETYTSKYDTTGKSILYLSQPSVSVKNVSTGVNITWGKSAGAAGYYVYRKTSGGSWSKIATIKNVNTLTYTDTKATAGTTYLYTVKAYNGSTYSSYNTGKTIKYMKQPTPSVKNTESGVKVTWTKITGASGYYVYRKTSGGSWSKIATIKSGSTLTYTDTKATAGTTYLYTVKSYSGSYYSSHNAGKTIKYLKQPSVSVSGVSSGVKITWTKSTGASGYYVYRKTSGGSWKKIATIKNVNTLTYTDTNGVGGTTYLYTVKAYSGSTYSSYHSGKSIKYDSNGSAYYAIDLGNGKTTTVYGYYDTAMADEIISQLNAYRKSNGVSTLTKSTALTAASRTRAYEISYLMDHTRPNGNTCFSASSAMYAENIAAGYPSADAVMAAWKASSGHNANMLRDGYQTVGVSVFIAQSSDKEGYRIYFVQNFGY